MFPVIWRRCAALHLIELNGHWHRGEMIARLNCGVSTLTRSGQTSKAYSCVRCGLVSDSALLDIHSTRTNALPEPEPQVTLRGHSAPITALALSSSQNRLYSASLDQTVQVWALPQRDREPYAPFDAGLRIALLEGHTDAIWDLALMPLRIRDEGLLATASADGTVKIWACDGQPSLKLSWNYGGVDGLASSTTLPAPTSIDVCHTDMRKVTVAYQDAAVFLFDVETGQRVLRLKSDETYGACPCSVPPPFPLLPIRIPISLPIATFPFWAALQMVPRLHKLIASLRIRLYLSRSPRMKTGISGFMI